MDVTQRFVSWKGKKQAKLHISVSFFCRLAWPLYLLMFLFVVRARQKKSDVYVQTCTIQRLVLVLNLSVHVKLNVFDRRRWHRANGVELVTYL